MPANEKFYNRRKELAMLEGFHSSLEEGNAVVLFGRRRVGKTELVKEFLNRTEGRKLYIYVDLLRKKLLLESFSNDISKQIGETRSFQEWEDFFDFVAEASSKKRFVLVIDEFQRFLVMAPEFITKLQRQWDERLKKTHLLLLLVGSSIGMIEKLTNSPVAPLYGRVSRQKIGPFGYLGFREMFKEFSEEEKVRFYAVFGGTPYYLGYARQHADLKTAIRELFLRKTGKFLEEPKNLMEYEKFRTHANYNSILEAIAKGKSNLKEMSDYSGIQMTTLPAYLNRLKELLDLVDKRNPVMGKTKLGRYTITDNFFRFWYRFIFPNQGALNLDNIAIVEEEIGKSLESYIGKVFEGIAEELLITHQNKAIKGKRINFNTIGSWWDRSGNEIDIVALNTKEKSILACEVKWKKEKTGIEVLRELLRKVKMLGFSGSITPVLISKNGFTDECLDEAMRINALTIDIEEMKSLFDNAKA